MNLDLNTLKHLAHRARDLEMNWCRNHPELAGSKETLLPHEAATSILAVIPGTKLVITHSTLSGNVICWDVAFRVKVGSLYVSPSTLIGSQPLEEEGKYIIAVLPRQPCHTW